MHVPWGELPIVSGAVTLGREVYNIACRIIEEIMCM
jgi:hypothetical protein